MAPDRRGPPDMAEIIRKRKEEAAAAAKPRYIPKKERARIAAEKEKAAEAEKTAKEEAQRRSKDQTLPTEPRAMRQDRTQQGTNANANANGAAKRSAEEAEIRERYMGPDRSKSTFVPKRYRKDRNQFNADWDPSEDTTPEWMLNQIPIWEWGGMRKYTPQQREESFREYIRHIEERDPEGSKDRVAELKERFRRSEELENSIFYPTSATSLEDKPLRAMKKRDWRIFKINHGITVKGSGDIPNPIRKWGESGLPSQLLNVLAEVGYNEPTPIQRAAIPIALQARDLIGVAATGSGKTASFLLPLLVYIQDLPPLDESTKDDGPYALILAPTRELAQQIEQEAKKFATPLGFTVVSIIGGHAYEEQAFSLRNGAEIVVATTGRLADSIERRLLVLSQCCYIIMDEADRMIDLGFEESLNKILEALPVGNQKPDTDDAENAQAMTRYIGGKNRYRQTMMYTATMPTSVEKIARKFLRRPAMVTIGTEGEAVETVEQRIEFVEGEDRRKNRLHEILLSGEFEAPIIVFVNIKRNCDMIARDIHNTGFKSVTLHSGKTQTEREAALRSLREGKVGVLVATDVAGRGIDIVDVSLVINFNMASSIESYTHRIGRTGRAGKSGVAITFLGPEDNDTLYDLKQMISRSSISKLPDELRRHEAAQQKPIRGRVLK